MGRIARIFLAGLLVLLPILVTLTVTVWLAQLLKAYAGPNSLIGRLIVLLGLNLVSSEVGAYFLGFLIILGCIFLLGLVVETKLWPLVQTGLDTLISRIPLVSNVYDLSKRFVAIVDRGGNKDSLQSMRPVWCFFGGEGWRRGARPDAVAGPGQDRRARLCWIAGPFGAGPVRRRSDLRAGRLGEACRRRRRAADERLCVDGRHPANIHAGAWGCPHWGFPEARACLAAKTQGGEAGRGRKLAALAAALLSFEFSKRAYLIGNAWNGCTPGAFIARQSSTIE